MTSQRKFEDGAMVVITGQLHTNRVGLFQRRPDGFHHLMVLFGCVGIQFDPTEVRLFAPFNDGDRLMLGENI